MSWEQAQLSIQNKMLQYNKINLIFLGQTSKVVANYCLNWIFSMVPSIVVLGNQI